jgi:hypothetical protein
MSLSNFRLRLFSLAPTSESLLLRPIMQTRFQFVRLTFMAVEVNDPFCGIAFFGHSASPSETFPVASVFWLANAEAPASLVASVSSYRRSEYVFVLAIVVAENKLIEIERQIFLADIVIAAHDPPFQQRPEAFNRVRVKESAHVFAAAMSDDAMRQTKLFSTASEQSIASVFIGSNQMDSATHGLPHETIESLGVGIFDHLADHVTLARDRADDGNLASGSGAADSGRILSAVMIGAPAVAVPCLAADVGFVHLDNSEKLGKLWIGKSGPQPMADEPCGTIRTGADHPMDLECADSLLAGQHQVENFEPHEQLIIRVLEDRADQNREPIGRVAAFLTDPIERAVFERVDFFIIASRASDAFGPALVLQILLASGLVRKHSVEVGKSHLACELWFVLCSVHARNIARFAYGVK